MSNAKKIVVHNRQKEHDVFSISRNCGTNVRKCLLKKNKKTPDKTSGFLSAKDAASSPVSSAGVSSVAGAASSAFCTFAAAGPFDLLPFQMSPCLLRLDYQNRCLREQKRGRIHLFRRLLA